MAHQFEFEQVREVAIGMAFALGLDPFQKCPSTGYDNAPLVEEWEKHAEWAARFLAAFDVVSKWGAK